MKTAKDSRRETTSILSDSGSAEHDGHTVRFLSSRGRDSDPAQIEVEVTHNELRSTATWTTDMNNPRSRQGHIIAEQTATNTGSSIMTPSSMFQNKSQSYEINNNDNSKSNKQQTADKFVRYICKPDHGHVNILNNETDRPNSGSDREVIRTITDQYYQSPRRPDWQQALTQRYTKILLTVCIISAFFFFPTGMPAVWFALKTREQFDRGIMLGDIEKAQRCAKRAQQLAIFSFIFCVLTVILTLAIYNRVVNANQYQYVHPGALT